jgi:uncharacterized protein
MSDHVASVQAIYDCFGRGDVDGILERLHPEVEWEHDWGTPPPALFRARRGLESVRGFFAELAQHYDFLRFEPVAFLTGGDMVAVPIHLELRHRASGRTFGDLEVHLWTFGADGRVTRLRHVIDPRPFEQA